MHSQALNNVSLALGAKIKGQPLSIRYLLACLVAGGHALLEDLPGTGKTTLARTMAQSVDARFARIQFTPDLMPSDITGTTVFNPREQTFDFHQGPIFCEILLADEINRASPRTQSALLEAMEEAQVSVEGRSLPLPEIFFVIATENPVEMHGTYPLPEAQLDRFMCKLSLGYVSEDEEVGILLSKLASTGADRAPSLPQMSIPELLAIRQSCSRVHISEPLARYITQLARFTRKHESVSVGASARGSIALMRMSQALALLDGSDHARASHAQEAARHVLAHRILLRDSARHTGKSGANIVEDALNGVIAPT